MTSVGKSMRSRKVIAVGDRVTCVVPVEAYSSGAPWPEQWFRPGMIGIVATTDTPAVYLIPCSQNCSKRHETFFCVDFQGVGRGVNSVTREPDTRWRVALKACNIKKV